MTGAAPFLEEPYLELGKVETRLEPKSEWWFSTLEQLQSVMIKNCEINVVDEKELMKASKLWFCGLIFISENHPSYSPIMRNSFLKLLMDILEGDNFWDYNPLRLVRQILWLSTVDVHIREKNHAFPLFRTIDEEHVSDQHDAIQYVSVSAGTIFSTLIEMMME
jgi:hypothetical protein